MSCAFLDAFSPQHLVVLVFIIEKREPLPADKVLSAWMTLPCSDDPFDFSWVWDGSSVVTNVVASSPLLVGSSGSFVPVGLFLGSSITPAGASGSFSRLVGLSDLLVPVSCSKSLSRSWAGSSMVINMAAYSPWMVDRSLGSIGSLESLVPVGFLL